MRHFTVKTLSAAGAAALVLSAGVAQAQPLSDDFYATGVVEYEHLDYVVGTEDLLFANFDVGFGPANIGLGVPIGIHFGVHGVYTHSSGNFAYYPTISFHPGFGTIQVGIPRAAIDSYVNTPTFAGSQLIGLQYGFPLQYGELLSGSVLTPAYVAADWAGLDRPYGLRYDGNFGGVGVGLSYHLSGSNSVLGGAVRYDLATPGNLALGFVASAEHVSGSGTSTTLLAAGVDARFNEWISGGLLYSDRDGFASVDNALHGYVGFALLDNRLNLTGSVLRISPTVGSSETVYGISADYEIKDGLYGQIGYAESSAVSGDILDFSLGVRF